MTVAAGGRVTGVNGVVIGQPTNSFYGSGDVSIDNSGEISGTGEIALLSSDFSRTVSSIVNRAGGTIGAIAGSIGTLNNAGTISGGNRSAIDMGTRLWSYGDLINSGTIVSTSDAVTLANLAARTLMNSGTIENFGAGAAIGGRRMTIVNAATGRIASAGAIAIDSPRLQLTNAGIIVGNVVAGDNQFSSSTVDSTAGRITGSLRFGNGTDMLVAGYDGTRLQYGVDGAIDGGAGTDTVRVRMSTDAMIATPLTLPTAFEQLTIASDAKVTGTLAAGFAAPGTLLLGGNGTIVKRAALSGAGQVIGYDLQSRGSFGFVNAGSITGTGSTDVAAINLSFFDRFENSGTISAVRNAVSVGDSGRVDNSGTITAGGLALSSFGDKFANMATGVIRSTGSAAVALSGNSYGGDRINAGRIEGVTGLILGTTLTNTGIIAGSQTGIWLNGYGMIENRAGATISGPVAITAQFPNSDIFSFNNRIINAGMITGDVILGSNHEQIYGNNNGYFALAGSVLNGNLTLGKGDLLITEIAITGTGMFAGITGRVTAYNAALLLRVRADTAATLMMPTGFASVGYDLFDDAVLTLTGPTNTRALTFAGRGTVELTADIAATSTPAIQSTTRAQAPGETYTDTALTITSRGTLSLTRSTTDYYPFAAVALGSSDSFTNTGTIIASDRATNGYNRFGAIAGGMYSGASQGARITNAGTITLDGTDGIVGGSVIVNNGTIRQAAGGKTAVGIRKYGGTSMSLTNTGTIDVAGVAVQAEYGPMTIANSGRIASSGDVAIFADTGYGLVIDNLAGGTIAGGANRAAIRTGGGTLTNAGTITGSVDLGYGYFGRRSFTGATYVADGGTIAGDLLFGDGQDKLVAFGSLGVTGVIDGCAGIDTLIHARRASDTVMLILGSVPAEGEMTP